MGHKYPRPLIRRRIVAGIKLSSPLQHLHVDTSKKKEKKRMGKKKKIAPILPRFALHMHASEEGRGGCPVYERQRTPVAVLVMPPTSKSCAPRGRQ